MTRCGSPDVYEYESEWIAYFPGRDNYCALFHFPDTLSEMSIVIRDVGQTCSFIVEILHIVLKQVVCTTGGGAGV